MQVCTYLLLFSVLTLTPAYAYDKYLRNSESTGSDRRLQGFIGDTKCVIRKKAACKKAATANNLTFSNKIGEKIDGNKWGCYIDPDSGNVVFDSRKSKSKADCGNKKCKKKIKKFPLKNGGTRVFCVPEPAPTNPPTGAPSNTPLATPSKLPTSTPSASPTAVPTKDVSNEPTATEVTDAPSATRVTEAPTSAPPSSAPSDRPSINFTTMPTGTPSAAPTAVPTNDVSNEPTATELTDALTATGETEAPTSALSSSAPSDSPSINETLEPTASPSNVPTVSQADAQDFFDIRIGEVEVKAAAAAVENDSLITCFDYTEVLELGKTECRWDILFRAIRDTYKKQARAPGAQRCQGGLGRELLVLTGTSGTSNTGDEWKLALKELCDSALDSAVKEGEKTDWGRIESADIDLEEFFNGDGFLNNDYGNLQQEVAQFERRGGYTRYNYIGEDPRLNDYLPTPQQSYKGGQAIVNFYNDEVKYKFLETPSFSGLEGGCPKTNAAVCCWSRDRQYNDNNGSCGSNGGCRNGNPGDNTDLCWTEDSDGGVFPYPESKTEGPLHCHGYSWKANESSDLTKDNNLFYVSMYDHLYKRGYANSITDEPAIAGDEQPMCGCVEDMHPIARADCTEIVPRVNYTVYQDEQGYLVVKPKRETFELEFNACQGYHYNANIKPEDWSALSPLVDQGKSLRLRRQNNDLSAFVFRQYLEGKKTMDETDAFEQTIIGYKDPNVNNGDRQREAACKSAFQRRHPGKEWAEIKIDETGTAN